MAFSLASSSFGLRMFLLLLYSIATVIISEAISWFWIYRTDKYKELQEDIKNLSAKTVEDPHENNSVAAKNRIESAKSILADKNRELSRMMTLPKMVTNIIMFFAGSVVKSPFSGLPVAALPFYPCPPFDVFITSGVSTNFTGKACSQAFYSRLLSFTIGPIIRRLLHKDLPRISSPFNTDMLKKLSKMN